MCCSKFVLDELAKAPQNCRGAVQTGKERCLGLWIKASFTPAHSQAGPACAAAVFFHRM